MLKVLRIQVLMTIIIIIQWELRETAAEKAMKEAGKEEEEDQFTLPVFSPALKESSGWKNLISIARSLQRIKVKVTNRLL